MHIKAIKKAIVAIAVLLLTFAAACSQVHSAVNSGAVTSSNTSSSTTPTLSPLSRTGPPVSAIPKPSASEPIPNFADQPDTVKGSGTIAIAVDANVNFDIGGKIVQLNVSQGDHVTQGQVLGVLDSTSLGVALAQAQVNLDQAILAKTSANLTLQTAQFTLDKTSAVASIKNELVNLEW